MRFTTSVFVAVAVFIPSLRVAAEEPVAQAAPQTSAIAVNADTSGADQVICHTGPAMTGTRLGVRRECHTEREWARMQEEEQKQLFKAQVQFGMGCPKNVTC